MTYDSHNADLREVEAWSQNSFLCPGCSSYVSLDDYPSLADIECPYCGQPYFTPRRLGKFWLFEHVAQGGAGAVYKAFHQEYPDKVFAVKILPPNSSKRSLGSLEEEARIMDALRSHNCMSNSLAWGEENGDHFIAMDFVEGERMDKKVRRLGGLDDSEVLLIMLRLLAAETHIYSRGFFYRDMKPQNVILNPENGAFLYDFGICVPVEKGMDDSVELIAGTPMYFPPERLTGQGESVASEIYSLGMLFYYGLKADTFFSNREIEAMAAKDVLPAMLISRSKMDGISDDLAQIITKMIQRDPKKRYQRFVDVERDIIRQLWVRAKRNTGGQLLTFESFGE